MLSKTTVLILGAGASAPYGFPTGWRMLEDARALKVHQIAEMIKPRPSSEAPPLFETLRHTGEKSIDAALEGQPDIREAGKAFIARRLLTDERNHRTKDPPVDPPGAWYRELFTAMLGGNLEDFRANPLSILTYNYDRSLEAFFINALAAKYRRKSREECAKALDCVGPWHLHGQLGGLPELPIPGAEPVEYGGSPEGLTDSDIASAAKAIQIVDEPHPHGEPFARARDAISTADRLVFLGFSFGVVNVGRLRLADCLRHETETWATAMGPPRLRNAASAAVPGHIMNSGESNEDVLAFLQRYYQLLEERAIA
jgi:hypothetical protein